jgi:hypothetical protein
MVSKDKKKVAFKWGGDWTVLWILSGFVAAYFVFVPLEVHPLHWLFSLLGGLVGYGAGLFVDNGLPPLKRFIRRGSRRMTLKPGGGEPAKRRK